MMLTFLGTGTSHGVPPIDCMLQGFTSCPQGVCRASLSDPKHRRTRSSVLLEWDGKAVIIDIGPDFRAQCLREQVGRIDAVLITHGHADHIFGISDLRSYTRRHPVPLYGSPESIGRIRSGFPYVFDPATLPGGGIPRISTEVVRDPFTLFGRTVTPVRVEHLSLDGCYGFRIGPLAYIPDMKSIADGELSKLSGTSVLVLNCLRRAPHHGSHLTLDESVGLARKIAPRQCYFIHMSHDIHYQVDRRSLDPWMEFAWDGLKVGVEE
jgi:phosphoribosyl 1,2-cyclic phosphate phosphodiesterase